MATTTNEIHARCIERGMPCSSTCPGGRERQPETVHIIRDEVVTHCGLWWAGNMIGAVRPAKVEEYRARPDIRICPRCETPAGPVSEHFERVS